MLAALGKIERGWKGLLVWAGKECRGNGMIFGDAMVENEKQGVWLQHPMAWRALEGECAARCLSCVGYEI